MFRNMTTGRGRTAARWLAALMCLVMLAGVFGGTTRAAAGKDRQPMSAADI